MDRRQDPRTIVTPYAFSVHPDLLGVPLATPWQRLGAITLDGVVIIGLSQIGGLTLAVASSILLFWLAFRGPGQNVIGKLFRLAAGCLGLVVALVSAAVFLSVQLAQDFQGDPDRQATVRERLDSAGIDVDLSDGSHSWEGTGHPRKRKPPATAGVARGVCRSRRISSIAWLRVVHANRLNGRATHTSSRRRSTGHSDLFAGQALSSVRRWPRRPRRSCPLA